MLEEPEDSCQSLGTERKESSGSSSKLCWEGIGDLWSPLLTVITGLTFLHQSIPGKQSLCVSSGFGRLEGGWYPSLAQLVGVCTDPLVPFPHAAAEGGLGHAYIAPVRAQ